MKHALERLLASPIDLSPIESLAVFHERLEAMARGLDAPPDRALLSGLVGDRVAYAFAGGYRAALASLVRGKLDEARASRVGSICITEEGGGHPRAVKTTLRPIGDGRFTLTGRKQWATAAPFADVLLVAASTGADEQGRNRLVIVAVETRARPSLGDAAPTGALRTPGVTLEKMPDPPFAPELPHAVVKLEGVEVTSADILPGDGYEAYVKPFRTIEDAHVFLALTGHIVRAARAYGGSREIIERAAAIALSLRAVAEMDPSAPTTHVALAGALDLGRQLVTDAAPVWANAPTEIRDRWERDRALAMVAERARAERRSRAWERLAG